VTASVRRLAAPAFVLVAIVVGACGSNQASSVATATASASAAQAETREPTETVEPVETVPETTAPAILDGQTETDWGRIWDSLPSGFPIYPGSTISEEAGTGPASAVYVAPTQDAEAIAVWMQDALEQAAFSTEAMSGPLEDGSFVIDSVGQERGCRLEVSIAPLGGTTMLTILYGAGCPHD
jgi:hypothetical protein